MTLDALAVDEDGGYPNFDPALQPRRRIRRRDGLVIDPRPGTPEGTLAGPPGAWDDEDS